MQRSSGFVHSAFFNLLLIVLLFILPIRTVFENTFHDMVEIPGLYDHIVTIAQNKWVEYSKENLTNQQSLYAQVVINNAENIMTKKWVKEAIAQFANQLFLAIKKEDLDQELSIDITLLKKNYLIVLKGSEISEEVPRLEESLPDKVALTAILQAPQGQVKTALSHLITVKKNLNLIIFSIATALFIISSTFFISLPLKQAIQWLTTNTMAIGGMFLIFFLVFSYIIHSDELMKMVVAETQSANEIGVLLIGAIYVQNAANIWKWFSIGAVCIGSIILPILWLLGRKDKKSEENIDLENMRRQNHGLTDSSTHPNTSGLQQ